MEFPQQGQTHHHMLQAGFLYAREPVCDGVHHNHVHVYASRLSTIHYLWGLFDSLKHVSRNRSKKKTSCDFLNIKCKCHKSFSLQEIPHYTCTSKILTVSPSPERELVSISKRGRSPALLSNWTVKLLPGQNFPSRSCGSGVLL